MQKHNAKIGDEVMVVHPDKEMIYKITYVYENGDCETIDENGQKVIWNCGWLRKIDCTKGDTI